MCLDVGHQAILFAKSELSHYTLTLGISFFFSFSANMLRVAV